MPQLAVLATAYGASQLGAYLGASALWGQVGWALGSMLGNALFNTNDQEGPRLQDTNVQTVTYGSNLHLVYGTGRVNGTIIWAPPLNEYKETTTTGSFFGIGGSDVTTYRYTAHVAIGLCEGPIDHVRRIWANGNLIYEYGTASADGPLGPGSPIRIYKGTETQEADPLMTTISGWAMRYKGLAYVVFEDFELEQYGNRIPEFSFEVTKGGFDCVTPTEIEFTGTLGPDLLGAVSTGTITGYEQAIAFDPNTKQAVIGHYGDGNGGVGGYLTWWDMSQFPPVRRFTLKIPGFYVQGVYEDSYTPGEAHVALQANGSTYSTAFAIYDINNPGVALQVWLAQPPMQFPYDDQQMSRPMYRNGTWHTNWTFGGGGIYAIQIVGDTLVAVGQTWPSMNYARGALIAQGYGTESVITYSQGTTGMTGLNGDQAATSPIQIGIARDTSDRGGYFVSSASSMWKVTIDEFGIHETKLKNYSAAEIPQLGAAPFSRIASVVYFPHHDKVGFLVETNNSGTQTPVLIDPESGEIEYVGCQISVSSIARCANNIWPLGSTLYAFCVPGRGADHMILIPFFDGFTRENIYLYEIVDDLSERVSVGAARRDTSSLTDEVYGYVLARPVSARDGIEPLMTPYVFDAVESDAKMKFVKRGGTPVATIPNEDLAIIEEGTDKEIPPLIEGARMLEQDLPQRVTVRFVAWERNYDESTQYAERLTTQGVNHVVLDVPVPLTHAEARSMAETTLYDQWIARTQWKFSTTREFAFLDPTDSVYVVDDVGVTHRIRIVKRGERPDGAMLFEGVEEDDGIFTRTVEGDAGLATDNDAVAQFTATNLFLLDIPLLRDTDDADGVFYAAANSFVGGGGLWPGASFYRSTDSGTTWDKVGSLLSPIAYGYTVEMLQGFEGGNVFDMINVLRVRMVKGEPESSTTLAVLAGANMAVVGNEIIQFTTVTAEGDDVYAITGLLRGRRGTEHQINAHASGGDTFIILPAADVARVTYGSSEIGTTRQYHAVTNGMTFSSGVTEDFTLVGYADYPYAVTEFRAGKGASGDMKLAWTRRARTGQAWLDYTDVALDEDTEDYEIEFWDSNFETLVRTVSVTDATTYTYPYATWSADFTGSPVVPIGVRIYQISAVVGRGFVSELSFDPT